MSATSNRLDLQYIHVSQIKNYDKNPRNNEIAVPAVMKSIQDFGFRIPVVLDKDYVLVAGHTRVEAARRLGIEDIPAFIASDLTPQQIAAFRLVDNKASELATWDFDLLAGEVAGLAEVGIDLTPYGWTSEELDCLREVVTEDVLETTDVEALAAKADGINGAIATNRMKVAGHITNDAQSVKISVGEFGFFLAIEDYRAWAEEVRKGANYDRDGITMELAKRLGMLEQVQAHDRKKVAKAAEVSGQRAAAVSERAAKKLAEGAEKKAKGKPLATDEKLAEAGIATSATEAAATAQARTRTRSRPAA